MTFTTSTNLTNHKLSHSEEKSFTCSILCQKSFKSNGNLSGHKEAIVEKNPICLKVFRSNSDLPKHKQTHKREKTLSMFTMSKDI